MAVNDDVVTVLKYAVLVDVVVVVTTKKLDTIDETMDETALLMAVAKMGEARRKFC